jgi:predicted nuclease of restriction endonuclease-like (RecB) superfamily
MKKVDSTELYNAIRPLVLSARQAVARGVNLLQVHTNYEIGRRIVEREQGGADRAQYGKEVIKELAERLTSELGNGFSKSNLEYMRRFYLAYPGRNIQIAQTLSGRFDGLANEPAPPIAQTASGQSASSGVELPFTLSWSHYVFLLGLGDRERRFYEIEAAEQGWTLRDLKRQFSAGLYERLALSRDKKAIYDLARQGQDVSRPQDILKEPYVLEFLGLEGKHTYSESDFEAAIVEHVQHFLLELGKGFPFEARQKRFTFDEEHFFIDLVFYNRLLKCYVLIDLKIGKLTHQDLGQMQMYVNYFDRFIKLDHENSTVGIVLCKKKNAALVEITLPKDANIHAREYQLYLPSKEELQQKLAEWIEEQAVENQFPI